MKCPYCGHKRDRVVDSRAMAEGSAIRRRRECGHCRKRYTTYERVEDIPIMVIKRDQRRENYDRAKIAGGIRKACQKRPISEDQIERSRVVGGAPRELVKIKGVGRPCPEQQIDVETDHIRRIRTGLHENSGVSSLHVVADLVDGEVEVLRTEAEGSQLRLYFSKTG